MQWSKVADCTGSKIGIEPNWMELNKVEYFGLVKYNLKILFFISQVHRLKW